ncbi:MAG: RHS repeat-associated core domain-containing protein, partial [Candidatus Thiodiazotropha sp.]
YRYDEQGRITGIDYNGVLQNYDYDLFGRLTHAETELGSYRYEYDSLGNRTQKLHTDPKGNTTSQKNQYPDSGKGNRLLSQENAGTQNYRYNPAGSPEQIGERLYEYDAYQRPVKLYMADRNNPLNKILIATYTYNRFGERIKKVTYTNSIGPKVTYYLYDSHQLTAEIDDTGKITSQYLYQPRRPIIKLEGKTAYTILTDHLGTPRVVIDEDQQAVWSADYSPFGLIKIGHEQITLNLRLPGQYEDQESGYYYNYQRNYDASLGRYIQSDPIGLAGGLNTYAYANSNPIMYIDPLGLMVEGTYDRTTGILTITNLDNGQTLTAPAFSGAPGQYQPAPNGTYTLTDFPWGSAAQDNYFALLLNDGRLDDYADGYPSNYDPNQTMSNIRLHSGYVSHGCVTVPSDADSDTWLQIQEMIQGTSQGDPIVIGEQSFPNYGTIHVIGSGFGSVP